MNRLWAPFLIALLLCVPVAASAQSNLPIFDPEWQLVPEASELDSDCPVGAPLGFGGVLQLIQNGMNAAISFGVIMCVIVIAFAGILWLLTPTNPENHSQAKKVLTNAVIGLLIILSAWLIVDFVMKLLYDKDNTNFGPWNEILVGGDICVTAMDVKPLFSGSITAVPGAGSGGPLSTSGRGACNATLISRAAAVAGITMPTREANLLACLAGPESSCGTVMQNYNWDAKRSPPPSTAYGPFQITLKGNSDCFETPACYAAAGVTGPLNCKDAFNSRGYSIPGTLLRQCQTAAANLSCSAAAAHCVYLRQGPSAWTADANSSKQQACIRGQGS